MNLCFSPQRAVFLAVGLLLASEPSVATVSAEESQIAAARNLLTSKRFEEVPLVLGKLTCSADPDVAAEALLILGHSRYEMGQFDLCLQAFRKIYELSTNQTNARRAHLAAGWALWKLHRYDEIAAEVAPAQGHSEHESEFDYLLGMAAYGTKDWEQAIDWLRKAADQSAIHAAPAQFYLAESSLCSSRHKEAKSAFRHLVDRYPDSNWADDAVWGLVRTARAANLSLEVQAAKRELREKYPTSEYVAQIPLIEVQDTSSQLQSTPGLTLFEEAVGRERDGDFDAALAVYHHLLASGFEGDLRAEGLWRAGRLHHRLKQYSEATKFYDQVLAEFPQCDREPEVLAALAGITESTGKYSQAATHCRTLLDRFPKSPQAIEAAYWLALAAADEREYVVSQEYVDWLQSHLDSKERDQSHLWRQTLCLQCQIYAAGNQWQQITELIEVNGSQLGNDATGARLAFWLAEALFRLEHVDEALEQFSQLAPKTVGINESWVPMVALRRAQIAARRENWQDVLKQINELDERYPEFELGYECDYLRGRALAGRGEMSEARAAYGEVLNNQLAANTETAAMAQWMIGETYFHQRNYELAKIAYEKVIEKHNFPEWQARAALQAGKCAELRDDWSEAVNLYSNALECWQETDSVKELNARLRWVQKHLAQRETGLRR